MTDPGSTRGVADQPVPVVSVRGEVTMESPPEIARVWATTSAEDRDRRAVLEKLARRNDELLTLVRSYGDAVEHVETGGMSVYPVMKSQRREEKVRFYHGVVRTQITVRDFAVLGELAARLADMEMVLVENLRWELRQDSLVYRKAREAAAREAVRRAREYAGAVGGELTALLELADLGLGGTASARARPTYGLAASTAVQAPGGPPAVELEPQIQSVHASVEARFTMTQPETLTSES